MNLASVLIDNFKYALMGCERFDWLVFSSPIPVSLIGQKNDGDLLASILISVSWVVANVCERIGSCTSFSRKPLWGSGDNCVNRNWTERSSRTEVFRFRQLAYVTYVRTLTFIGVSIILELCTLTHTPIFSQGFFNVFKIFLVLFTLYCLKAYCYIIDL